MLCIITPVIDRGFCFHPSSHFKDYLCYSQQNIRLSLPSKGRLETDALEFLSDAGLAVFKPNPRQYQAEMPALPDLGVIFQRPGDIVVSVRQGSIDFGITGLDMIEEKGGSNGDILILHDALGFGSCALTLAVPESLENSDRCCLAQSSFPLHWKVHCV